ncbi:MAG: DUF4442 domain-containing protein [Oligoflexus sp.]
MNKLVQLLRSPTALRLGMNLWPPFLGAGIRVESIQEDYRCVQVALLQRFYNRNYVGTHFGGSMFAMLDPFFMLMVMKNLGEQYYVWDRHGEIDFVAPGRGKIYANLVIKQEQLDEIIAAVAHGEKYEPEFATEIVDKSGELVARYCKKLYVRLKPRHRP